MVMAEINLWLLILCGMTGLLALLLTIRLQRLEAEPRPTLRDYLAAKAAQGLLANSEGAHRGQEPTLDALIRDKRNADTFAELAYDMADAMLRARSQP